MPKTVLVILVCLLAATSSGQWLETTIRLTDRFSGATEPTAILHNSVNNRVYVGGENVVVVDGATNQKVGRIPVAGWRLGFNPTDNKVYAVSDSLYIIDGRNNQVIRALPFTAPNYTDPAFVYNSVNNKMYFAAGQQCPYVVVIDGAGDSVLALVQVGDYPFSQVYNPTRNKLYCMNLDGSDIAVIDGATDSVLKRIELRHYGYYRPMCYNSRDDRVYCAAYGRIWAIDCESDSIVRRMGGDTYWDLCYDSVDNRVYCLALEGDIIEVDCAADSIIRQIPIPEGRHPWGLWFSSVANKLYCACDPYYLAVVDCASDSVVAFHTVGWQDYPAYLCDNPLNNKAYCVNLFSSTVTVVDGVSDTIVGTVILTHHLYIRGLVCVPARARIYCVERAIAGISVIDCVTNRCLGTKVVGVFPGQSAYNPANGKVYLSDIDAGGITVLGGAPDTVLGRIIHPNGLHDPLLLNPATNKAYAGLGDTVLGVIDCSGDTFAASIPLGRNIYWLLGNPVMNRVYAGDGVHTVTVIDGTVDSILGTFELPGYSTDRVFSRSRNRLYCLGSQGSMWAVDCATHEVVASIVTPPAQGRMIWNPVNDRLYYPTTGNCIAVVDCASDSMVAYVPVDTGARYLACDTLRNRIYCGCSDRVWVLDGAQNAVIRVIATRGGNMAWDPAHGRMYVVSSDSTVAVIRDTTTGIGDLPAGRFAEKRAPTFIHGSITLDRGQHQVLFDISGRRVLALKPGPNDVSHLAPGVYFIREKTVFSGRHSRPTAVSVRKAVFTK